MAAVAPEDRDSPLLVAVHGWLLSGRLWEPLDRQLQGRLEVWRPDLPGFGAAERPRGLQPSLASYGRWLADAVRRRAGTRPVLLVGHSLGGSIVLHAAPGLAGQLRGVVLVAAGGGVFQPRAFARVRQGCGNPQMTVVVVQLGAYQPGRVLGQPPPAPKPLRKGTAGPVMRMREIQRRCVLADPAAILVTAMGRETQDNWHLSTAGQIELGREIGRALAKRLHGVATGWPGPVLDAAVLGADGRTVTAHFAEVERLSGIAAADFAIVDAAGPSAVIQAQATSAEPLGGTRIRLTFNLPITLPAALVYGAGDGPAATLVDEAGNRAPAVQRDITAGPMPDDVVTAAPNGAGN
ncbi:MAG: alpha/beta fold hydrolase [Planctomycetia bacterium]|nr:alpha/beta fold hydrolase [Planctomycetia bacterium]